MRGGGGGEKRSRLRPFSQSFADGRRIDNVRGWDCRVVATACATTLQPCHLDRRHEELHRGGRCFPRSYTCNRAIACVSEECSNSDSYAFRGVVARLQCFRGGDPLPLFRIKRSCRCEGGTPPPGFVCNRATLRFFDRKEHGSVVSELVSPLKKSYRIVRSLE